MTRAAGIALVVLLAPFAGFARSQPPAQLPAGRPQAQPGEGDPLNTEVDNLLRRWHKKTSNVKHLYAEFSRITKDLAFGTVQMNDGSARYRFPNLARLDINADAQGQGDEHLILTEQVRNNSKRMEIWHYKIIPPQKGKAGKDGRLNIRTFANPNDERDLAQEGPLKLIFGLEPAQAHARYEFRIIEKDKDSTHVSVRPRLQKDLEEYQRAELWLRDDNSLPKRLRLTSKSEIVEYRFACVLTDVDNKDLVIETSNFKPLEPGPDGRIGNNDIVWKVVVEKIKDQQPDAGRVRQANAVEAGDVRRNR